MRAAGGATVGGARLTAQASSHAGVEEQSVGPPSPCAEQPGAGDARKADGEDVNMEVVDLCVALLCCGLCVLP